MKPVLQLVLLSLVAVSGIVMLIMSRPYGSVLSSIHKILAVLLGGGFTWFVFSMLRDQSLPTSYLALFVFCALLFILSVVSGAVLLGKNSFSSAMLWTHRIATPLTLISGVGLFFLLR